MKRILSMILALCCIFTFSLTFACAKEKPTADSKVLTYGDVNQDYALDVTDIMLVRAHIIGTKALTDKPLILANVNEDENVDIIDIVIMRNAIVNDKALDEYVEETSDTETQTEVEEVPVIDGQGEIEFEDGKYRGTFDETYGHNGKSILFEADRDYATVKFQVSKTDTYTVFAYMLSPHGDKVLNLEFNGTGGSTYGISKNTTPQEYQLFSGTLEEGKTYSVKATPNWTYIYADYVKVVNAESISEEDTEVDYALSNPNASENAKALYSYICEIYKHNILTGQQESTWMDGGNVDYEMDYLMQKTGKLPAVRGLDFIDDDFDGCVSRSKDWYNKGGIVTICWHCGPNFVDGYQECLNKTISNWDKALTEGTPEYEKLIAGMDKGAAALKELADAGVPVLWRPFHELDGKWFWWGKGGEANFIKLWKIMYDRYTNYWGLDNLIWVCGFSQNGLNYANWYPGDEYVDIAGADSYHGGSEPGLYNQVKDVVRGTKPLCFHECGDNPTVDQLVGQGAKWVYFMTWHTSHLTGNNVTALNALYNSDYAITLDELPDFYGLKAE